MKSFILVAEVVLHGMHFPSDLLEAVVDDLELHSGFTKLFVLALLKGITTVVEFSLDLPMIQPCHVLCISLVRWRWLGRLTVYVHDAKLTRIVYMEENMWRVILLPHLGDCIKPIAT